MNYWPFERRHHLGQIALGNDVFVALRAADFTPNNKAIVLMKGGNPWLQHLVGFYLCAPYTDDAEDGGSDEQLVDLKFQASVRELTRVLVHTAFQFLPSPTKPAIFTSRLGRPFALRTFSEHEHVTLLQISRDGAWPTLLAHHELLDPWIRQKARLYAGTSRNEDGSMNVELKGRCDLTNETLLTLVQTIRTGETITNVLGKLFSHCDSQPKCTIIGAFSATPEGIVAVKEAHPSAIMLVLILHRKLDRERNLIDGPGCGDVSRKETGVRD